MDANTETTVKGQKSQLMGQISFRNVEFGYDDHTKILKNVDIEINPRQIVGITGKSGCGKKYYKVIRTLSATPDVALDNVDLRLLDLLYLSLCLCWFRELFFPGTIRVESSA